jgi:hypothetical protein
MLIAVFLAVQFFQGVLGAFSYHHHQSRATAPKTDVEALLVNFAAEPEQLCS